MFLVNTNEPHTNTGMPTCFGSTFRYLARIHYKEQMLSFESVQGFLQGQKQHRLKAVIPSECWPKTIEGSPPRCASTVYVEYVVC